MKPKGRAKKNYSGNYTYRGFELDKQWMDNNALWYVSADIDGPFADLCWTETDIDACETKKSAMISVDMWHERNSHV